MAARASGPHDSFGSGTENVRPGTSLNIGRSQYIPFGWCGMYHDEYTGRYHTHYRQYDPLYARWLCEDPAGYRDGLNLYAAYMGVNGIDPLGLRNTNEELPDWATADLWDVLKNPNAYKSEDLDDNYEVDSVSDLMKFPEGRIIIGMYLAGDLSCIGGSGGVQIDYGLDHGYFDGDEFYLSYPYFPSVRDVKRLVKSKEMRDYAPERMRQLARFAVETAVTEVYTAGIGHGLGALMRTLRVAGAGTSATKTLSIFNSLGDDAARGIASCAGDVYRPVFRTNAELVQEVGTRAEKWGIRKGLGNGPVAGTLKHGYADDLLTRYQLMWGDRGLSTEVRYFKGAPWEKGIDPLRESIRLDVVEGPLDSPSWIWDYKFGNSRLGPRRIDEIRRGAGLGPDIPIVEVKP